MTSASNHEHHTEQAREPAHGPGRRRSLAVRRTAATIAALLGLAALTTGCGGSNNNQTPAASAASSRLMAQFLAYARCMRSHGAPNFPDPSTSAGIGITLPHRFNTNSPAYLTANQACQALAPAAHPTTPTTSAQKLASELKSAQCMRSHGLPSFPDPNSQGTFDLSKLNKSSPAFKTAYNACKSLIAAVGRLPGH